LLLSNLLLITTLLSGTFLLLIPLIQVLTYISRFQPDLRYLWLGAGISLLTLVKFFFLAASFPTPGWFVLVYGLVLFVLVEGLIRLVFLKYFKGLSLVNYLLLATGYLLPKALGLFWITLMAYLNNAAPAMQFDQTGTQAISGLTRELFTQFVLSHALKNIFSSLTLYILLVLLALTWLYRDRARWQQGLLQLGMILAHASVLGSNLLMMLRFNSPEHFPLYFFYNMINLGLLVCLIIYLFQLLLKRWNPVDDGAA
jgi:hypothetical protein